MFGIGSTHTKILYGAVFDITSESVGVAIVESDAKASFPKIIFSHRVHMRLTRKKLDIKDKIRIMKEALFSASLIISRDGLEALALHNPRAKVEKILVTCSAPWSYTISRNVSYTSENELKVSRDLIHDLVESAESEIAKHLESEEAPTKLIYEIVERATIDVRINDYSILNPIGLRGKEVSLSHVTGLIPREVIAALTEVEEKIFPNTQFRAHTFMLVLYCILRELYATHSTMTIVHITGDTTEFGIVEGDTLVESISIPFGLESVVRGMMRDDTETATEMYSQLELYERNELTVEAALPVKSALDSYAASLSESLSSHITTKRFPKTVFILAPSPFTTLFTSLLEPFFRDTLGISGEILRLEDNVLNASTHTVDDNLSISSRFFHKLHGCGEIDAT